MGGAQAIDGALCASALKWSGGTVSRWMDGVGLSMGVWMDI